MSTDYDLYCRDHGDSMGMEITSDGQAVQWLWDNRAAYMAYAESPGTPYQFSIDFDSRPGISLYAVAAWLRVHHACDVAVRDEYGRFSDQCLSYCDCPCCGSTGFCSLAVGHDGEHVRQGVTGHDEPLPIQHLARCVLGDVQMGRLADPSVDGAPVGYDMGGRDETVSERIAEGTADIARDVVTFQITREALANLIDWWNKAEVRDPEGYIIGLTQHEYAPGLVELTGTKTTRPLPGTPQDGWHAIGYREGYKDALATQAKLEAARSND